MLALILVSLLIIGVTTIVFFNNQNENYHAERLIRKEKTIIMSLQYFFKDLNHMENMDFVLKDFDYKIKELSDVNKIEINVFNLNGDILMSSKYDYTNPDFYTFKMNPSILNKLKLERQKTSREHKQVKYQHLYFCEKQLWRKHCNHQYSI